MIQASELRIGNWVYYVSYQSFPIKTVKTFHKIENARELLAVELQPKFFEPIPLTPDILVKCGAKPFPTGDLILNNHLITFAECRSVYVHSSTSVELNYLHQLQNLYYALTQTELEINL